MTNRTNWGNPREFQIAAEFSGEITREISKKGFFRGEYMAEERQFVRLSTEKGGVVEDDMNAMRYFKFRCGLVKVVQILSSIGAKALVILNGYNQQWLKVTDMSIHIEPTEDNDQGAVADVYFQGYGTRYGELLQYRVTHIRLCFKDNNQLRESIVVTAVSEKQADEKNVVEVVNSGGGDDAWPFALVAGVVLGATLSD